MDRRRRDLIRFGKILDVCGRCGESKAFFRRGDYCEACRPLAAADARRAARRRRRARERNIAHEPYTLEEIAQRDRYRCGICRKRVAMRQVVPHPKAPTIDHLIPVSDGGDDIKVNVQLAHFICNSRRGNRGVVQLALVG
jgi:5-methylcytosine-specific restriction endonuclease McrA